MTIPSITQRPLVTMKQHDFLKMMRQLEQHGEHRREAGAFLLGSAEPSGPPDIRAENSMSRASWVPRAPRVLTRVASTRKRRRPGADVVTDVAYYNDLDPGCLTGGITFHAVGYTRLNELCRGQQLRVVADLHLHPGDGTRQSSTDADHPMVARAGHLALIAPRLGAHVVTSDQLGAHVKTQGGWADYFGDDVETVFQVHTTLRGLLRRAGAYLQMTLSRRAQR